MILDIPLLSQRKFHHRTDEFTTEAQHFREFGCYTKHPKNDSPNSPYQKYWIEQARRCIHGYHAGHDWIPGYYYWYLNWTPIMKLETDGNVNIDTGLIHGSRIQDFPNYWDYDYDYFHYLDEAELRGSHGAALKTRGRGFSFKSAGMLNRNYFLIPGSRSFAIAYDKDYLLKDGLLTKAWAVMDFIDNNTAWAKRRTIQNDKIHKRASYRKKVNGVWTELGYKSEIIGISVQKNPDAARGIRGKLIIWEESGKNPYLLEAWEIALKSMQQGRISFGLMVMQATGGTQGADIMGVEELIYNSGYNVYLRDNVYEGQDKRKIAFFFPEYMNREGKNKEGIAFIDENGNSRCEIAIKDILEEREAKKKNTTDPNALSRHIAEQPIFPSEALIRVGNTKFPINDLKARLAEVLSDNKKYYDSYWFGRIMPDQETGKMRWENTGDKPLWDFPIKSDTNTDGCITIYEQPVRDPLGNVPWGLYIASTDPYAQDKASTFSLGSTFIMNRLTERIVAEYTARPATENDYYENVRRLLLYYNAIDNYENNIKGMFNYFEQKTSLFLLADTPRCIIDKIHDKNVLERSKGTPATTPIIEWGLELIKKWLIGKIAQGSEIMNLQRIPSVPLLKELIYWDPEKNYDRVSSLIMLMILKEEFAKIVVDREKVIKTAADDPFWDKSLGIKRKVNPLQNIPGAIKLPDINSFLKR